jgi:hypothetical protein
MVLAFHGATFVTFLDRDRITHAPQTVTEELSARSGYLHPDVVRCVLIEVELRAALSTRRAAPLAPPVQAEPVIPVLAREAVDVREL